MLHSEVETVRAHHGNIGSNNSHQTSPTTLAQKTPFAIQELLGLTNTPSEHDSINPNIKQQIQNGEQNNPFSYYNSKESLVNHSMKIFLYITKKISDKKLSKIS